MNLLFGETPYFHLTAGLRAIGYQESLLQENYEFGDWFRPQKPNVLVAAAAFGQTPISYDSACIGIVHANGLRGQALVDSCRALGAPIILEIADREVSEWAVSSQEGRHGLIGRYASDRIGEAIANRAPDWRRDSLFRAKNIGSFRWTQQLGLFAGLLPELESHIQASLDPLLRDTLSRVQQSYRESTGGIADPSELFRLVFWVLTAKVFHDRGVSGFESLGPDPDSLLAAVGSQYKINTPSLLDDAARRIAVYRIWNDFDFRNLSVEVLSQIWSSTLVDKSTRKQLGIHRTSRTLVRYIAERMPFDCSGDDGRIILEPCSGSAGFLVGMMNLLRQNLFGMTAEERHRYFTKRLVGIEKDPFGVEISRLALTLADFPNPDGWDVTLGDAFAKGSLTTRLQKAGVVLCNPPFETLGLEDRKHYETLLVAKPALLLSRVLDDLNPSGVLGFVLPRKFIDGGAYAETRKRLAARFASVEITVLPDRAFKADAEVVLLVATDPIPHNSCRVFNRKVDDNEASWRKFEMLHEVSAEHEQELALGEHINFVLPDLPEVWSYLIDYPILSEVADLHRGIEWKLPLTAKGGETGNRSYLVKREDEPGYCLGVAPKTLITCFDVPKLSYLNVNPTEQRGNAWKFDWAKPKAILNKSARSRGPWRMAAFPDTEGVVCYQTFIGVWPKTEMLDEWAISAVLNSPVANAFVATRAGKTDINKNLLELIPIPHFTSAQNTRLHELILTYRQGGELESQTTLRDIDALVLDAYMLPPRLECQLLKYFSEYGHKRPTARPFGNYQPGNEESPYFSLSDRLSPKFKASTSGELLKRMGLPN